MVKMVVGVYMIYKMPFKTPVDYWTEVMGRDKNNFDRFVSLIPLDWKHNRFDTDLHIYPYTEATPGALSMGCNNRCQFCPTNEEHQGNIVFSNYETAIIQYKNLNVHFMDENFFKNDLDIVLPLLKKYNVRWLCMSHYVDVLRVFEKYGEQYLYDCGLRVIEIGLENVVFYKKVKKPIEASLIKIAYLNMTFFEGETKETILENAEFMKICELKNPLYFTNYLHYTPGQFLYPYNSEYKNGIMLDSEYIRTQPTYIPNSFLSQTFDIIDLEKVNFFNRLVYGHTFYPSKMQHNVLEYCQNDYRKYQWVCVGIRCGGII